MSAAPAIALVPRRHSLVEHLEDVEAILDTLDGLDDDPQSDETRDALSGLLIEKIAGTKTKIDSSVRVLANFEAAQASAKAEAARLEARAKYFARQQERLENYLLAVLDASQLGRIDGNTAAISRRKNPPKVDILDANLIPWEFMRLPDPPPPPPAVPDKAALKVALKSGPVDGCRLLQGYRLVRS